MVVEGKRLKEWKHRSIDFIDLVSLKYVIAQTKCAKNRLDTGYVDNQ